MLDNVADRSHGSQQHVLGHGGRYIFGPSHVIQAGTPPENIVAMFDAVAG